MMDLGTVKKKLERGQYGNAAECAADIRLIWDNCKLYNMQGSDFHLLAESFSRRFEDRYKKICAEYDTGEGTVAGKKSPVPGGGGGSGAKSSRGRGISMSPTPSGPITLDARVALGAKIFKLSGMELGHAINILELRCPEALVGCGGAGTAGGTDYDGLRTDELEIDIDAIDSRTFNEVSRYVSEALSNGGRTSVVDEYSRSSGGSRSRNNSRASSAAAAVEDVGGDDDEDKEEEFEYEEEEEDEEEIAVAEEVEDEWDEDDEDEIIVKHQTKRRKTKD